MYVLELAAQNVRGLSPTGRTPLKPGYNLLKPPTNALPPIGQLAIALCFSDGRGTDSAFLAQGAPTGKAGLTILGNDQVTYRLLRELGGAGALHKLNATTQKFELVSEDASEISQFLRSQVGLPSKLAMEQLYCLTANGMPSRRPKKAAPKPGAPAEPQRTISRDNIPVAPADDVAAAERRLADMQVELKAAKETAAVQFEFDGIVSEIYDLEKKAKDLGELKTNVAEAKAALDAAPTPESLHLPADLIRRCEHYNEYVAKRDAELAKLKDQKEEELEPFVWEGAQRPKKVAGIWEDPRFWYGVGGGVAALVLGMVVSGSLKYLALLDIPAFGFSGILALQWIEELQTKTSETRRGGRKAAREAKIQQDFEGQALAVQKAMTQLDVESPEQVIAKLKERDGLFAEYNRLRAKADAWEADPNFRAGQERLVSLRAEHDRLNAELASRGGYMREPREIEKDMDRLKQSIALARGGAAHAAPVSSTSTAEVTAGVEDPSPQILKLGADLLQTDVPSAIASVRDRSFQYFAALTDKRYAAIEFDLDGRGFALAGGNKISVSDLPPKDADLFALALRLTVVEKATARQKIPLFIEDGVACVDEVKLPLLARMLKHLGTMTQVIHVTAHPGFTAMADHTANI
ncbi:MAG: chromosome segregation protein SMC [Myxococcaceae bacterium]